MHTDPRKIWLTTCRATGDRYSRGALLAMAQDCGSRMELSRVLEQFIRDGNLVEKDGGYAFPTERL